MKSNLTYAVSLVPVVLVAASCGGTTSIDVPAATATADEVAATDYESGLAWAAADTVPVGLLPADVVITTDAASGSTIAAASAAAARNAFSPSGCVAATAGGNVATFVLSNCSGPLEVASASGTFTATFSPAASGLGVTISGNSVKINNATLDIETQGTFTSVNGTNTFAANSTSSGTGPNGNSTARSGSYTIAWPVQSTCGTLNAGFNDSEAGTSTKINNVAVCRGMCPTSGTATRTLPSGSVTVTYNGTDNLAWKASSGSTGTITIRCP